MMKWPPARERFLARIDKSGECWLWMGTRGHRGYGQIRAAGRNTRAHRFAWELANGPIPDGLFVLHHCDNPPCVNLAHLFLGTHSDNMRDRAAKGRANLPAAEDRSTAKLTWAAVRDIRRRHAEGERVTQLAREYGVCSALVSGVVAGSRWQETAA